MRLFFGAFWLVYALACLAGCQPEKQGATYAENQWFTLEKKRFRGPYVLHNIIADPQARRLHTTGISVRFAFGLNAWNRLLLRDETDHDIESYRLTAQVLQPNGQPLLPAYGAGATSHLTQQTVFRLGSYTLPEFFFPYRGLPVGSGSQQVLVRVQGFAQKRNQAPDARPSLTLHLAVGFVQPAVQRVQVLVESFALDTEKADPHSFDFRMAGSGYPDLSWRLFAGTEVVHTGRVAKNKTEYTFADATPVFYLSETDSGRLQFYEHAQLSDHDLLATSDGLRGQLPAQTGQILAFPGNSPNLLKDARVWHRLVPTAEATTPR